MFKVSQEIYVNASDSANHSNTYGRYQRLDDGEFGINGQRSVFVAPELSEVRQVAVHHFPVAPIPANVEFDFIIAKNGAHGNVAVKLITPGSVRCEVPLALLTPDSYSVRILPVEYGVHKVHIRLNDVELPLSPLSFETDATAESKVEKKNGFPAFTFKSDASLVQTRGLGLHQVSTVEPNEFTVDASEAGNNILFVAICGPDGCQCDEVAVRHVGNHVYTIAYSVRQRGAYSVVIKWGDDQIPKSPFRLNAT